MGLGDDVKQVVGQVASDIGGVATDTVKAAAKTPLDILEEILGGTPAAGDNAGGSEAQKDAEKGAGGQDDATKMAAIQQKLQEDKVTSAGKLQMHRQNMAAEQQFYEQDKAQKAQQAQAVKQEEKQNEQFEIQQLQHEDAQLATAQMANDAERSRNMGAG